ncbi:HNH endonuclease [Clostridium perfringens]|uniref:HNH endonuclease n=1 Tax=Clostridium perfringens TaxID=1502 RepID=UPI0013E32A24|nr:HNH endonuclease [Clostridium perfringens]NGT56613.1 HNH endonuclease [Clostridium perfringens]NGT56687.1 HNH endonuclease [Clostridium perfringens]NGT56761.1 HNH endonuclease [Clostridium perfringens]
MNFRMQSIEVNIKKLEIKLEINSLKEFLIEKYIGENLSIADISFLIYKKKSSASTVRKYMNYFGIKKRTNSEGLRVSQIKKIEKALKIESFKDFLIKKYWEENLSASQIAQLVYSNKKNTPSILRWMKYFNISRRSLSESVKLQYSGEKGMERKEIASKIAKEVLNSKDVRSKLINIMQTKEYKNKQRISKLGERNGMFGVIGEKHPSWNPNKTRLQRQKDRKLKENKDFILYCLKRDNYTCQHCYTKSGKLNVHHLDGYSWCIEKRFDVDNGITLCEKCHKEFHHIYGFNHSTKEQFIEFNIKK